MASDIRRGEGQRTRPESRQRASPGLGVAREQSDHVAVALARRAHEAQLVFITIRPLLRFKGEIGPDLASTSAKPAPGDPA